MTRFARAKGSKASNQRIPDEGTPWSEIRQQIQGTSIDSNVNDSAQEETNWKVVINNEKKVEENLNSVWCDFSDSEDKKKCNYSPKKRNNTHMKSDDSGLTKRQSKKRKAGSGAKIIDNVDHQRSSKKDCLNRDIDLAINDKEATGSQNSEVSLSKNKKTEEIDKPSDWVKGFEWKDSENVGGNSSQVHRFEKFKQHNKFKGSKNWSVTGREFKKFSADNHSRRKYDQGDITLNVNGENIVVTKLDGFYIRKEDAHRIKELEQDMLKRGIPKAEIRAVVKRERRNAEKSLARQKKKVCFHCRKGGHNLSSCPKLSEGGSQTIGSGICYKCGSTEHSHLQCRVASGQTYKFATCFICKEEGHIAKQCPDNPRGLYPDGGGCKLCGDVTHFKKDCPKLPTKTKITVGMIDRDIETLGDIEEKSTSDTFNQKKKKKVINFK